MVEHDKFIFLHLQKTAGTFVSEFLTENIPGAIRIHRNTHRGFGSSPKNKILFGVIRNPFDWYVSHWGENHVHGLSKETFPNFMDLLYRQKKTLHDIDIKACNSNNIGSLTYRYNKTYKTHPQYMIRFENIKEDLENFFININFPLNPTQISSLYNMKPRNVTHHKGVIRKPYQEYHNKNTIDSIQNRDKLIIKKYGYKF